MKKIFLILAILAAGLTTYAQDFNKNLDLARSAYTSGKLEDSRFAMQQMLQELDIISGKEVLKILPAKLDVLPANTANDNVSGAAGFAGAVIHRDYGNGDKTASIEVISNSPLIASVNAILAIPFIGRAGDGSQKVIKIEGYKALIQKNTDGQKTTYDVQVPLNSTLVTLKTEGYDGDVEKLAMSLPVSQIVKALQ